MTQIKLPNDFRPKYSCYKKLTLGLDLPAEFYYDIKSIDNDLYFVFHNYECMYEDIINNYTGKQDDPRWCIHTDISNNEIWGWPLTLPDGAYKREGYWHIWSLARDKGWSHVSNIASTDPEHLYRIVNRLGREKLYKARYGAMEWNQKLREDTEAFETKQQLAKDNQFKDIQRENRGLMRKAMENLERGIYKPTRPTKDIVVSYPGQKNRTKIVRDITDKEGGLVSIDE